MNKIMLTVIVGILMANAAYAEDALEASMLRACVQTAEILNKSGKVNINLNEITPFVTWRASCSEKPPAGAGNVMALCEGTSIRRDGKGELLFFWSKTAKGKINTGYFVCRQ